MNLIQYITIYFLVGVACSFSFETIYRKLGMDEPSTGERFYWLFLWPIFVLVFIWGAFFFNDDDDN